MVRARRLVDTEPIMGHGPMRAIGVRGSTCTFGAAPQAAGRWPASTAATSSSPTVAATSGRGSTRPEAYSSIAPASPPEALSTPTTVTSLSATVAGVDQARLAGESDVDDPPAGLDAGRSASAGRVAALEASTTASKRRRRQRRRASTRDRSRATGRSPGTRSSMPEQVHLDALGRRRTGPPAARWCPGPRPAAARPGDSAAARTARSALPPGSTSAPSVASTVSGSGCSALGRHGQLLGQRARPAAADADLVPVGAQVLAAGRAAQAVDRSRAWCRR